MLRIRFGNQGDGYQRQLIFPDGRKEITDNITISERWHSPEQRSWSKAFHEYSREELEQEGELLAEKLLSRKKEDVHKIIIL